MTLEVVYITGRNFLNILPILIAAIVASQVARVIMPNLDLKRFFGVGQGRLAGASVLGMMIPGPLVAFLPLLRTLRERGLPVSLIVAFTVGQTMIGPARVFLELHYFGFPFLILKVVLSLLIAYSIANCFLFMEKHKK